MTSHTRTHRFAALACALSLTACGSTAHHARSHEHSDSDLNGPELITAPLPASIAPNPAPRTVARQSATPAGAITAYATAFARSSSTELSRRESTLLAYATPAFAARLRSSYAAARAQTARALPAGAAMTGSIEALALHAPTPVTRKGVVALTQSLQLPGEPPQRPVTVDYAFTLRSEPRGWRVASFVPLVAP